MNPMNMMADAEKLTVEQLQQAMRDGTLPAYIGIPILQEKVKMAQAARQSQQAPQQPPVAQQVMQAAQQMPPEGGISGLAGGGIVAFAGGGQPKTLQEQLAAAKEQLLKKQMDADNVRRYEAEQLLKEQQERALADAIENRRANAIRREAYADLARQTADIKEAEHVGYTAEELANYKSAYKHRGTRLGNAKQPEPSLLTKQPEPSLLTKQPEPSLLTKQPEQGVKGLKSWQDQLAGTREQVIQAQAQREAEDIRRIEQLAQEQKEQAKARIIENRDTNAARREEYSRLAKQSKSATETARALASVGYTPEEIANYTPTSSERLKELLELDRRRAQGAYTPNPEDVLRPKAAPSVTPTFQVEPYTPPRPVGADYLDIPLADRQAARAERMQLMNAGQASDAARDAVKAAEQTLKPGERFAGPEMAKAADAWTTGAAQAYKTGIPGLQALKGLARQGLRLAGPVGAAATAYDVYNTLKVPTDLARNAALMATNSPEEAMRKAQALDVPGESIKSGISDLYNRYFGADTQQPTQADAQAKAQADAQAKAQADAQAKAQADAQAATQTKTQADAQAVPQASPFEFKNPAEAAVNILRGDSGVGAEARAWALNYQKEHPEITDRVNAPEAPSTGGGNLTPGQARGMADRGLPTPFAAQMPTQAPARSSYADLLQPELSPEEYEAKRAARLGPNTGIESLRGELARMKEGTASEKDKAGWLALMQAGLATMGGQSPNALANIAQGAQVGFAAYGKEQEKFDKAQDKYFDIQAKLEDATRREQEAAVKYGEDSAQRVKASNQAIKLAERQEKAKFDLEALKEGAAVNLEEMRQYSPENSAQVEYLKAKTKEAGAGSDKAAIVARNLLDSIDNRLAFYKNMRPAQLANNDDYKQLVKDRDAVSAYLFKYSNIDRSRSNPPPPATGGGQNPSERFFRPVN